MPPATPEYVQAFSQGGRWKWQLCIYLCILLIPFGLLVYICIYVVYLMTVWWRKVEEEEPIPSWPGGGWKCCVPVEVLLLVMGKALETLLVSAPSEETPSFLTLTSPPPFVYTQPIQASHYYNHWWVVTILFIYSQLYCLLVWRYYLCLGCVPCLDVIWPSCPPILFPVPDLGDNDCKVCDPILKCVPSECPQEVFWRRKPSVFFMSIIEVTVSWEESSDVDKLTCVSIVWPSLMPWAYSVMMSSVLSFPLFCVTLWWHGGRALAWQCI